MVTAKQRDIQGMEGLFPFAAAVVTPPLLADHSVAVVVNDDFSCCRRTCFFAVAVLSSGIVIDSLAFKARHG